MTLVRTNHPADAVDALLDRVGNEITLGIPLGLGKPNHLVNELYQRALVDPSVKLRIFTALTLSRRDWHGELERRLVQPLNQRLFGDYPELAYTAPLRSGELPDNIDVREFYFAPGTMLESPVAQQRHVSLNYSQAVRHAIDEGVNLFAQLVGTHGVGRERRLSLSCNSDVGIDLVRHLRGAQLRGGRVAAAAEVHGDLPFMPGPAEIPEELFDVILDMPPPHFKLVGPPNQPVELADHAIGLHASATVRDGGTLQLGIGALSDAVVHSLVLRHGESEIYRRALSTSRSWGSCKALGGIEPFRRGLYAATEMLVPGFLVLRDAGILRRHVYPHAGLQRLLDDGVIDHAVSLGMLARLREHGIDDPVALRQLGVLATDAPDDLDAVEERHLGPALLGGVILHAGFFLGPPAMYEALDAMSLFERAELCMAPINFVNELHGDHELKVAQRRHARFINSGLVATLGGAVASDGLETGHVVSGVGGQFDFVSMAHALPEARSILLVRSTRTKKDGGLESSIRHQYGHTTIPRHLRDVVITEYGIADLRGRSDAEVCAAMIEVADSRFQDELVAAAKRRGKLPADYRVPDACRHNVPQHLEDRLAPVAQYFPELPFGSDLTRVEIDIARALRTVRGTPQPELENLIKAIAVPPDAEPYLERMDLLHASSAQQRVLQRILTYALSSAGIL